MRESPLASFLTLCVSMLYMTYIGMFIVVLEWEDALSFHRDIYHWGTVSLLTAFTLSFVLLPPRRKTEHKQ